MGGRRAVSRDLKAGVVGTGFIGAVHVDALRRLGVEVTGVVGSTPERAAAKGDRARLRVATRRCSPTSASTSST